jgi:hypothetical protein
MGEANCNVIDVGEVGDTLLAGGFELTSVLSAAETGVDQMPAAMPPATRARHQRRTGCGDIRLEFFKVHQR